MRIYRLGALVVAVSTILALQGCVPHHPNDGWRGCPSNQHFDSRFNRCLPNQQDRYDNHNWNNNHDTNRDRDNNHNRDWNRDRNDRSDSDHNRDRDRNNNPYYNNYR